jgi:hypothetical protein
MFAFSKAIYFITEGSRIIGSTINMSGGIITSHAQPLLPTDVANKEYVDLRTSSSDPPLIIALTGTVFTVIASDLSGNFTINIKNVVVDGPSATFLLAKSSSTRYPAYTRNVSMSGATSNEKLDVSWDPGSGVKLRKTGVNYDGDYKVIITKNN